MRERKTSRETKRGSEWAGRDGKRFGYEEKKGEEREFGEKDQRGKMKEEKGRARRK